MPKRVLYGKVVSDKAHKTVVVSVERTIVHPLFKKIMRRSKKFHAHDEENAYKIGDEVEIVECAPRSKLKTWEVVGLAGGSARQAKAAADAIQTPAGAP